MLLQASIAFASFLLLAYVVYLVGRGGLQLRYALLWLALAVVIMACSIFPEIPFYVTGLFGFEAPANFIFMVGVFFLLVIVLSLSVIISKQSEAIKNLTQRIAILEYQVDEEGSSVC